MKFRSFLVPASVSGLVLAGVVAVSSSAPALAQPAPHGPWQGPAPAPAGRAFASQPSTPTPVAAHLDARLNREANQRTGTAEVVVRGDARQLASAVSAVRGRVVAAAGDAVTATVPVTALRALAAHAGVSSVAPPVRAYTDSISQGVHASNADAWQLAGQTGAGVKVAIVDGGFAGLDAEVAAHNLPDGLTVTGDHCADSNGTEHGTAVAEIVHQMAPDAQLLLYCIDDNVGFEQAETELQAAGVKIVNSSLGFPGDSRGDGTGPAHSAAATVRTARLNGILWVESAGNLGDDHWQGQFVDGDHNGVVDLVNSTVTGQDDAIGISAGSAVYLQWDKWPTSTLPITLHAQQFDGTGLIGSPVSVTHTSGTEPIVCLDYPHVAGDGCAGLPAAGSYDIWISMPSTAAGVHYDLSYWGAVNFNYLSCGTWSSDGLTCLGPAARAQSGSVTSPASSPYALAVGAVDAQPDSSGGACGLDQNVGAAYPLEEFSSQGPTIDARVKPDIAAFDGVDTNLSAMSPFCGTSAAAPHVAGAAALAQGANPAMDVAQIQAFLEHRAGISPPNQRIGHGILALGDPTEVAPPTGSGYTPLSPPKRILDTRQTIGLLGTGKTVTITVPNLPADATAVAVNLTGVTTGATYLSVYPGGKAWPGTSNLNLSSTDKVAAVFAAVPLGAGHQITVRNGGVPTYAIVDVLGYFSTTGASKYGQVPLRRILDTRTGTGAPKAQLGNGKSVTVHPPSGSGVPAGTTALIINVTAANAKNGGDLDLSPTCSSATSTLNYGLPPRANMAIVGLSAGQSFCVLNRGGPVDAVVDLVGYLAPSGIASFVPLDSPVRIVDTRTGNGGRLGALGANTSMALHGAGIFDVPYSASALMTGVLATNATVGSSYITVYSGATRPNVSTLNVSAGRTVANGAVINLTSQAATIYNASGSVQIVADLFGYFD